MTHEELTHRVELARRCFACKGEIENRGWPSMSGPGRDFWVHLSGGQARCYPEQGENSPRAIPDYTSRPCSPVDIRDKDTP